MSGYLFPQMSQGPSDIYMQRGKLSVFNIGDWYAATALGTYEAPALEYPSYIHAGPLVMDGLLQVHRSGAFVVQYLTYVNGQTFLRVNGNVTGNGVWTAWTQLTGGGTVVGSPSPAPAPAPAPAPVGSPSPIIVGSPVGSPVG